MKFSTLAAVLAITFGTTAPIYAEQATANAEQSQNELETSLQATIDQFNADFEAGNYDAIVNIMPPKLLPAIAEQYGMPEDQLRKMLPETMKNVMSQAEIHSFKMADAAGAVKSAEGLNYAILSTETDISVGEMRQQNTSNTIAVMDDGKWYLMRVDNEAQAEQLKAVYPELASVTLR